MNRITLSVLVLVLLGLVVVVLLRSPDVYHDTLGVLVDAK